MRSICITQPESEPLTVDQVRDHLRVDHTDEDAYLLALITAARSHVEEYCHIALIAQDWRLTLDSFYDFDGDVIRLQRPPLIDVILVRYVDTAGVLQTVNVVDNTFARISDNGLLSCISPAFNTVWPSTASVPGAVQVEYTAGYSDDAIDVPAPLTQAMLLLISHWYKNREAVDDKNQAALPFAVEALLAPFVVPVF